MQQQQEQPHVVEATMPISITLEAQQWNQVMAGVGEMPWRLANPLMNAIGQQMQAAAGVPLVQPGQQPAQPGNGLDHSHPDAQQAA